MASGSLKTITSNPDKVGNETTNNKQKSEVETMRKWTMEEINGERFEVNNVDVEVENGIRGYDSIYMAYERPSSIKVAIWYGWYDWFRKNDGYCRIVSRNCNFFSIAGYVTDEYTKERYYCYITASHNKAWKVVEG